MFRNHFSNIRQCKSYYTPLFSKIQNCTHWPCGEPYFHICISKIKLWHIARARRCSFWWFRVSAFGHKIRSSDKMIPVFLKVTHQNLIPTTKFRVKNNLARSRAKHVGQMTAIWDSNPGGEWFIPGSSALVLHLLGISVFLTKFISPAHTCTHTSSKAVDTQSTLDCFSTINMSLSLPDKTSSTDPFTVIRSHACKLGNNMRYLCT